MFLSLYLFEFAGEAVAVSLAADPWSVGATDLDAVVSFIGEAVVAAVCFDFWETVVVDTVGLGGLSS